MSKQERVIPLPAVMISRETAEALDAILDDLEAGKVDEVIREEAQSLFRQLPAPRPGQPAYSEAQVVAHLSADPVYRDQIRRTHGARYTFVSQRGSVQFVGEDYSEEDIPKDLDALLAEARGSGERYLALHIKANTTTNEVGDVNLNRILIQSSTEDRAWVNDTYERLKQLVDKEENLPRFLTYKYTPVFVWSAFLAVSLFEYRIVNKLTGFSWTQDLNGLQLLTTFVVLTLSLFVSAWLFQRLLHYSFPYFELEGNTSRRREDWRIPLKLALSALYGSLVWQLAKFVVGAQ